MKKIAIVAAAVAALAFSGTAAHAHKHHKRGHKQTEVIQIVNGAVAQGIAWAVYDNARPHANASAAGWGAYGAGVVGCMALSPIITTAIVNRPLTMREAWVGGGNCVLPIVGGWLVNAAFDAHGWDGPPPRHHHRKRMKKS